MSLLKPDKTIGELQQESDRIDAEITYEQKRAILAELRRKSGGGLTLKDFGGKIRNVIAWIKAH